MLQIMELPSLFRHMGNPDPNGPRADFNADIDPLFVVMGEPEELRSWLERYSIEPAYAPIETSNMVGYHVDLSGAVLDRFTAAGALAECTEIDYMSWAREWRARNREGGHGFD